MSVSHRLLNRLCKPSRFRRLSCVLSAIGQPLVALTVLALALATGSALAGHKPPACNPFEKQVSIDGGNTWHDADDEASAPKQKVGGGAIYRFVVKNCEPHKYCKNIRIKDNDPNSDNLGIPLTEVPLTKENFPDLDKEGQLGPGEEIVVTSETPGFEDLHQPDRCETPGWKINKATEKSKFVGGGPAPVMHDKAYLKCKPKRRAALGDRVWEDLNANGIQDCIDGGANDPGFPADGIIGNEGDAGPECDAGVPEVTVNLLPGDCDPNSVIQTQDTDENGFYFFDELVPDDYCVQFVKPGAAFCDTDGFELGEPQFTEQDVGDDEAVDSDADTETGITDPVDLSPGETDLTVDAGIFCPAKIGDRVWEDLNENGIQNDDEPGVEGVTVELFECGPDGEAGTGDDFNTGETRETDNIDGLYMFGAEPDVFDLAPGKYYVRFDKATFPEGFDFTTPNTGPEDLDSDCLPPDGITSCVTLGSRGINLDRDCGIVPPPKPECDIELDKKCRVETPPTPPADFDKCKGKLRQFTVVWEGGGSISDISPNQGTVSTTSAQDGEEVTFFGPYEKNDIEVSFTGASPGMSTFHVSCSDKDFNSPDDCGKPAGNGKKDDGGFNNSWALEGFIDAEGRVLDCTADNSNGNDDFTDSCSFVPSQTPSCDTTGKPDTLTWRYDGGTGGDGNCADSTFATAVNEKGKRHKDFECVGSVNVSQRITVVDDKDGTFFVEPGNSFTTSLKASKKLALSNGGGTQSLEFHTSCSQPIAAGLTAGALTLEALDGESGGAEVTYEYLVTNESTVALTNVSLVDDQLGVIAEGLVLDASESRTFDGSTMIAGTTINVATAKGSTNFEECSSSDSVIVKVDVPPPPPVSKTCKDIKEITGVTMIWDGPDGITAINNETGETEAGIQNGDEVVFSTPKKDTEIDITGPVNGQSGQSVFHVSCSDKDMDGTDDCGKLQGNGKKDEGDINLWRLEGMTGEKGSFTCSP